MLEKYKEIYDEELSHHDSALEFDVLNSKEVRAFAYEICKNSFGQDPLMIRIDSLLSALKHRHASILEKIGEYQEVCELNDLVQKITRKRKSLIA